MLRARSPRSPRCNRPGTHLSCERARANNFLYSINIMPPPASDKQFSPDAHTHTRTHPHIIPDKGIGRHDDKSRAHAPPRKRLYIRHRTRRHVLTANNCATCHCSHGHPPPPLASNRIVAAVCGCGWTDLKALHSISIEPERIHYHNFSPIVNARVAVALLSHHTDALA